MRHSQFTSSCSYRVGWFVEGTGRAWSDVCVEVAEDGRIEVGRSSAPSTVDLGDVALIPGLVNAHTHLEFSLLEQPIPTSGRFTDWIRSVVKYRREQAELGGSPAGGSPRGVVPEAIRAGIAESRRCGTTLIGDIATSGWLRDDYLGNDFAGIVFQELIGLSAERVVGQCELARQTAERASFPAGGFGLSPHAPYSVHPELFQTALQSACAANRPLAMHLAETEAELELLADGTGEFREMLTEFGLWREGLFGGGKRPQDWLTALSAAPRSLVVHGNYLDESELRFLASQPQMTLVYCPRTHAAFGHRDHPWRRLLELGGSVAFGTDSRASNPDLSLFAELQFVAEQHPDLSHLTLLDLATSSGRRALWGDAITHLPTDFTLVRLTAPRAADLSRDLFASSSKVVGTVRGGRWAFTTE